MEDTRRRGSRFANTLMSGIGQLSLVEHALCPLDARISLKPNLRHTSEYRYTDANGCSQAAHVVVHCPGGLSAGDEFYLWGLLALTFAQPEQKIEFQATPHFCLRKLGMITPDSKGGKSYRLFREALRRLSAVHYQNERFYDPIRREHRAVSFGLFSYSLPINANSSRAWRIIWDPLFFEICQATASQLRFDLETYRHLDPASRRLFLLLSKVFWRKPISPRFDVRHLAVNVLGFSSGLAARTLKAKLKRCIEVLNDRKVITMATDATNEVFHEENNGHCTARFARGPYFKRQSSRQQSASVDDSPMCDLLTAIGFERAAIERILRNFKAEQIQLWADVTLAAIEHKGPSFFRRSPQAFFMDNIQNAAEGNRTPPEWFWAIRASEQQRRSAQTRQLRDRQRRTAAKEISRHSPPMERAFHLDRGVDDLVSSMSAHFLAAGQGKTTAQRNAKRFAEESLQSPSGQRARKLA